MIRWQAALAFGGWWLRSGGLRHLGWCLTLYPHQPRRIWRWCVVRHLPLWQAISGQTYAQAWAKALRDSKPPWED